MKTKRYWFTSPLGFAAGMLNGFFGSGGGIVGVPILRLMGLETRQCHATCIAVILPLTAASAGIYLYQGVFNIKDAIPYLPGGIVGALAGARLLPKLKNIWLKRVFGALILFAAIGLLTR